MKTTLDLPDHLLLQAKQRALQEGRTLRELVADYIRQGLHGAGPAVEPVNHGVLRVDARGFPLFRRDASSPAPAAARLASRSDSPPTGPRLSEAALKQSCREWGPVHCRAHNPDHG